MTISIARQIAKIEEEITWSNDPWCATCWDDEQLRVLRHDEPVPRCPTCDRLLGPRTGRVTVVRIGRSLTGEEQGDDNQH